MASALEKLASSGGTALNAGASTSTTPPSASSSAAAASDPGKRGRGRPPKDKAPDPAPATTEDADDLDFGGEDEDDFLGGEPEVELTAEKVREALVAYQAKPGQKQGAAKALLKKVGGVDVLTDLKPDKYKSVIDATK